MKVAFYTLGCKTNQFETQALERLFEERGHQLVPFSSFADVYIVNTCTVTALSDKKSRNAARRCKKINPDATLIVCGCYAQVKPEDVRQQCGADYVIGSNEKGRIIQLAERTAGAADGTFDLWHGPRPGFELLPAGGLHGRTRAMLKVQDGCQNFCAYCLIPFARGPSRSLPLELARQEAARLKDEGFLEIVITGIEISSYGADLPEQPTLTELIEAVCTAAPGVRIRLGSLEPRTVTEDFAARCAVFDNLCPHFHLSLQSGCDRTLKAMNRRYDTARFAQSCDILRRHFPGCAITTDMIVGFPGETEEDFAKTLDYLQRIAFAQVHIFPYSRRSGTRAASMPGQVLNAVKEARAARAAQICDGLQQQYLHSLVGRVVPVLFEQEENGGFTGHCPQYCAVWAEGRDLHNRILPVRITGCDASRLTGVIDSAEK